MHQPVFFVCLKLHTLDMSPSVIMSSGTFLRQYSPVDCCLTCIYTKCRLSTICNMHFSTKKNEQNFCFVTLSAFILVTFRNQLTETFLYDKDNNVFSACTYNVYVIYTWELKLSCWWFKYKIDISIYKYFVIHEDWWTYRKLKQNLRNILLRHFFL